MKENITIIYYTDGNFNGDDSDKCYAYEITKNTHHDTSEIMTDTLGAYETTPVRLLRSPYKRHRSTYESNPYWTKIVASCKRVVLRKVI